MKRYNLIALMFCISLAACSSSDPSPMPTNMTTGTNNTPTAVANEEQQQWNSGKWGQLVWQ